MRLERRATWEVIDTRRSPPVHGFAFRRMPLGAPTGYWGGEPREWRLRAEVSRNGSAIGGDGSVARMEKLDPELVMVVRALARAAVTRDRAARRSQRRPDDSPAQLRTHGDPDAHPDLREV